MEVKLRKLHIQDLNRIYKLFSVNVLRNLYMEKRPSLTEEKKWLKRILGNYKKKNPINISMGIEYNKELVGVIGAKDVDWKNKNTEIGYWIGEEYWGGGITPIAIKKFVGLLFKKYKLKRIWAPPFLRNKASQRVLEKAGFKKEGARKSVIKKGNKFLDDVLYALVK